MYEVNKTEDEKLREVDGGVSSKTSPGLKQIGDTNGLVRKEEPGNNQDIFSGINR